MVFPVGDDIEDIVIDWINFLRSERTFEPDCPLFPATRSELDADGRFAPAGLDRRFWKNADAIRRIFRERFEAAGLPYFHPHSFRKTLGLFGLTVCRTEEEWSAWSLNLGHENPATTFKSYATVPMHQRGEIFDRLRARRESELAYEPETPTPETIAKAVALLTGRAA